MYLIIKYNALIYFNLPRRPKKVAQEIDAGPHPTSAIFAL